MQFAQKKEALHSFVNESFFAYQHPARNLTKSVDNILKFLENKGFIRKEVNFYNPTPFGRRTSQLYLDPFSAINLKEGMLFMKNARNLSNIGILHLICHVPDMEKRYVGKNEIEHLIKFSKNHEKEFLFKLDFMELETPKQEKIESDKIFITAKELLGKNIIKSSPQHVCEVDELFLSEVKTAALLLDWINEENEDLIMQKYNIMPGDLYRLIERADWLLYSLEQFYILFKIKEKSIKSLISSIRIRIKYGIKQELVELASIKGIGRKRARVLYSYGYKSIKDLKTLSPYTLAKLPGFGSNLVLKLRKQLELSENELKNIKKMKKKKKAQQNLQKFYKYQ